MQILAETAAFGRAGSCSRRIATSEPRALVRVRGVMAQVLMLADLAGIIMEYHRMRPVP